MFSQNGVYLLRMKEGDVFLTAEQIAASENYKKLVMEQEKRIQRSKQLRGVEFVKQIINKEFKGLLTGNDSGHALECAVRIKQDKKGPKGGFLIMSHINGTKPANFSDMREIFGLHKGKKVSSEAAAKTIKKLEKKSFLWVTREDSKRQKDAMYGKEIDETIYEINPKFFARGKTENVMYAKIYLKHFKEVTKKLTPAEKGFLLEVTPYFHYDLNVLCKNPNETDKNNLEFFTVPELIEHLNSSKPTINKKINALREAGILLVTTGKSSLLYLHPDLVIKKDIEFEDFEETDKLREMFKADKLADQNQTIEEQNELYGLFKNE